MFWLVKASIAELFHSNCHILIESVERLVPTLLLDVSIVFCLPLINIVLSEIFRVFTWLYVVTKVSAYLLWSFTCYTYFTCFKQGSYVVCQKILLTVCYTYAGGLLLNLNGKFGFCPSTSWNSENLWTFAKEFLASRHHADAASSSRCDSSNVLSNYNEVIPFH